MNTLPFDRIVTFGCSHTYGHGLSDCYFSLSGKAGFVPSKFAWPELLRQEFKLDIVNMGKAGASNLEILSRILEFGFSEKDLVIIQWTLTARDLIFNIAGNKQIGPKFPEHKRDPFLIKNYYRIHNEYDSIARSLFHIHHADTFLKCKNINHLHYIHELEMAGMNNSHSFNWFDVPIEPFKISSLEIDKANDGHHAGPKTQIEVSKTIIALIKEKYEKH